MVALDEIFGQKYGSRQENLLEAELDVIEERRAASVQVSASYFYRVFTAFFVVVEMIRFSASQVDVLWRQARLMVHMATNQLATALQLWATLSSDTYVA